MIFSSERCFYFILSFDDEELSQIPFTFASFISLPFLVFAEE